MGFNELWNKCFDCPIKNNCWEWKTHDYSNKSEYEWEIKSASCIENKEE